MDMTYSAQSSGTAAIPTAQQAAAEGSSKTVCASETACTSGGANASNVAPGNEASAQQSRTAQQFSPLTPDSELSQNNDDQQERAPRPVVLLVNLGTPDEPTPEAVRKFLREFLTDQRVIEYPKWLWRPLLEGIILRVRPKKVAHAYSTIWTDKGSPLLAGTVEQTHDLQERLGKDYRVQYAMCYGSASLLDALSELTLHGYDKVVIVPLYPQYSGSTTGAVYDIVARWMLERRDQMSIRLVRAWADLPEYIEAMAMALEDHWSKKGRPNFAKGDRVIASFHSIPMAMKRKGDPYHSECELTAELLRGRLGLNDSELLATYQSVFGPAEWIGPATIDTVTALGAQKVGRVDVICPGFVADCLETEEEIGIQNRDAFVNAGGGQFHYVRWANGAPACVDALEVIARQNLAGW